MTVLIIMMAGVFLGSKAALAVAAAFSIIIITGLQVSGYLKVDQNWRQESMQIADAIAYVLILGIIFMIAWMITKKIAKFYYRLKTSRKN